jgi:Uma2 family endonuclease
MAASTAEKIKLEPDLKPSPTYTFLEYLKKEERSIHKHEFYTGQIIRMPGSKHTHNAIAANLIGAFKYLLRPLPKRYIVLLSEQKVYIEQENLCLYPDALVICEKPELWRGREDLIINPLITVEVLSKSTSNYDRTGKFLYYQSLPSFEEYILVEQNRIEVQTWFKIQPDTWHKTVCTDINASIELRSLGVSIPLSEIYEYVEFPLK